jgi:hypothetical protein
MDHLDVGSKGEKGILDESQFSGFDIWVEEYDIHWAQETAPAISGAYGTWDIWKHLQ